MVLNLKNLEDKEIRKLMLKEVNKDITNEIIYLSKRLEDSKKEIYIELLKKATESGNADTLAAEILNKSCLKQVMPRRTPSGGMILARVPRGANLTLAEGEFNRFYLRGICLKAISDGKKIEVYRAKEVLNPRIESQKLIGKIVSPDKLLEDLRKNIGLDTALGLPKGPNSGLSGKLIN